MAKISAGRSGHAPATRSLREDQALLLRRRLPLVPRAASPHGGNLVAAVRSLFKRSNKGATEQQGIIRCRAGVGGQGSRAAMESPQALMCPLENGISGINKSSSDDRPGPCICDSKYVEDAKAARSVRVWDKVPIK